MKAILFDVGNTFIKAAVVGSGGSITQRARVFRLTRASGALSGLEPIKSDLGKGCDQLGSLDDASIGICSVVPEATDMLRSELNRVTCGHTPPVKVLTHKHIPSDMSFTAYTDPDALGVDRIAAAVAAHRIYGKNRATIAVDAGSAVNMEIVDATGRYRGGLILPGLGMMTRCLSSGTSQLPVVDPVTNTSVGQNSVPAIGTCTHTCIQAGLDAGFPGAVAAAASRLCVEATDMRLEGGKPVLVVTGGDAFVCLDAVSTAVSDIAFEVVLDQDLVFSGAHQMLLTDGE